MMKKIVARILIFAFLAPAIFSETRIKETVYVKKENGKDKIYGRMITYKNYHIWDRNWVYVFYHEGKWMVEESIGSGYCPTRYDTVSGDSIDGEPVWEYTDYSYEREIVFPSDYAFERLFVRHFWKRSYSKNDASADSDDKDDFDDYLYDRFARILSRTGKSELRLMRNTIYAWYNYPFKSKDLKEIFAGIFDYYPDPSVTSDSIEKKLSARDKKILDMIIAEEAR